MLKLWSIKQFFRQILANLHRGYVEAVLKWFSYKSIQYQFYILYYFKVQKYDPDKVTGQS